MNDLLVLLVIVIWGITNTFVKLALQEISPMTFLGIRTILTSIYMLSLLWFCEKKIAMHRADLWSFLLIGFIGNGLFQFFYTVGFYHTTASSASIILATSPLFGVIISILWGLEKANRRVFIGILVSILGIVIIVSGGLANPLQFFGSTLGDLLILGAAISFAVYTVFAKPLLISNSPLKVNTYMGIAGTLFLLPLTYSHLTPADWASVSATVWDILLFCAIITAGVSLTLWYRGVTKIGSTKTQIYQNLIPVTTIGSAVPLLGETISAFQVVGALVAVIGIYIARRG
jgi:drug/metabolite transporter (DMT)-like permease